MRKPPAHGSIAKGVYREGCTGSENATYDRVPGGCTGTDASDRVPGGCTGASIGPTTLPAASQRSMGVPGVYRDIKF